MDMFEKESKYYEAHKAELSSKYKGMFVVIYRSSLLGAYKSREKALLEAAKIHPVGKFLIKKVDGENDSVQRFSSRVFV